MPALPADVAKYTQDGIVIETDAAAGAVIKAAHIDARDLGDGEIEMFFTNPAHAQIMLNERFGYVSVIDPLHEGIEVEEALALGTTVPITPIVPSFLAVDESRSISKNTRTRAFAHDTGVDHFSVEVME